MMRSQLLARLQRYLCINLLIGALTIWATSPSEGAPLSFNVLVPDQTGAGGATYTFEGAITNATGSDLLATDLFLLFAGFDFAVVSLSQVLGDPDFLIPAGTTSPVVHLFDMTVGANALFDTRYTADVVLQDVFGNFSDVVTVSVRVVPEGHTVLLLLAAAISVAFVHWRRQTHITR